MYGTSDPPRGTSIHSNETKNGPRPAQERSTALEPGTIENMHWIGRLLHILAGLSILVSVGLAVAAAFEYTVPLMISSAISFLVGILLLLAAREFLHGAGSKGALLLTVSLIAAAAAYASISPGGTAFLALLPVIILAVVLPFVRTTTALMWILAASWIAGAGLVALNIFLIPQARLPPWFDLTFRVVGYAALLALTLSMLFHHHRRLTSSLESARADAQELRRAHQRQKEADEAKTRFLNSAAHELRTPLTPIMLQLAIVRRHPAVREDPRLSKSARLIDRNLHRLKSHVDDLLDIARLQTGMFRMKLQEFDLHPLMQEAVEAYRGIAHEKGLQLDSTIPPSTNIRGDPDRLLQVMFNLLSNAVKATPAGGRITVSCEADEDTCRVKVSDTGRGIHPRDQKRLFEPFERVGPTDGGAGLGLFISRNIAESHGGTIECTSEGPGKGSTFTVTLPRAPSERPGEATDATGSVPSASTEPSEDGAGTTNRLHRRPPTQTP